LKPLQTRSDILRPLDPGTGSAIEMVTSPIPTTDVAGQPPGNAKHGEALEICGRVLLGTRVEEIATVGAT
jgi:hypothetical protein